MFKLIKIPALALASAALLAGLTGCSMADDPAAVVTAKPDAARSASLDSTLNSLVSEVEGSRDASGNIAGKVSSSPGHTVVLKAVSGGKDFCLNLTDNSSGQSRTYFSATGKAMTGGSC
jgi:hypothetical protein